MSKFKSRRSTHIGKIISWQEESSGISGRTESSSFRILVYADAILRVTVTQEKFFEDFSYSVVATPSPVPFDVSDSENEIQVSTSACKVVIQKKKFSVAFLNSKDQLLNVDDELGTCWNGEQATVYKKLQEGERFIGLGEKTGPLDRKGHGYQHWNTDSYAYNPGSDPLYCSNPFYIGIHNTLMYGIYLDNTFKSFFNFGASNDRFSSFSVDTGELDYYLIHGSTIPEILFQYTHLTGRMPLPPKWSIGYQQCRYSYFPDKEVMSVADTFREKDIPADVIVFDIHYMDAYKIFSWHKDHFSNPQKLITDLKEKGFEVVIMCDPGIKVEDGYHAYDDGIKNDIFLKYPDGTNYTGQVWPGWCHFPDFTSPKARNWWKEKFNGYISLGIQGFWNDMNEIATWGNQLPENIEMDFEGNKDSIRRGRNLYGFQMARATYEGTKSLLNGKRPFNLTRSAFSGIQRYAAVWTGDNIATDEHMMLGIRMLNSMGITGMAFCGYDAGGFVGDASPKLFGRWISIASFSPFFRGHSMVNSRDAEPWSFGEEVEEISKNYIKLRYRLMPYLYSAFYEAAQTGLPINRSLAIEHPDQDFVFKSNYQHQYYFGPSLLVAPVESYKELTKVFLPDGTWYGLFDDYQFTSGEVIVECPIEKLPVFVKGSSFLVLDAEIGSNTQQTSETLEVHIYYSDKPGTYTLYQDDGVSFEYEKDNYCTQLFSFNPLEKEITIGAINGRYKSQYASYRVLFHGFPEIESIRANGKPIPLARQDYRFALPLRSFDPIVSSNDGYKITDLPYIELTFSDTPIAIEW